MEGWMDEWMNEWMDEETAHKKMIQMNTIRSFI